MDDPPKAHRWVQAGKMPALPGVASADRVDLHGETQGENRRPARAPRDRPHSIGMTARTVPRDSPS